MASRKDRKVPKEQMWTLLNTTARMVKFQYSASRATIHAKEKLGDYRGLLMADAYIAYRQRARLSPGVSCYPVGAMPAVESLLYEIERQIRGRSPAGKKKLRK